MRRLNRNRLEDNIRRAFKDDFDAQRVFGAAYWVYQQGQEPMELCFGTTAPGGGVPVTRRTLFRIASMTKPVTAVAMLLLTDRGLISLDDSLSQYLPSFHEMEIMEVDGQTLRSLGKAHTEPTIRQVLCHTAGIGSDPRKRELMTREDKAMLENTLHFLSHAGLDYEPGSRQQYHGQVGFDVLGKIIEIVTRMDFQQFLEENLFTPCGMPDTTFTPSQEQWRRMISMHDCNEGRCIIGEMVPDCVFADFPCTHYLAGAGLVSTLGDYAAFAQMLLQNGTINGKALLPRSVLAQMYTPQVSPTVMPGNERWGLGVRVITDDAYPALPVGSYGWSGAYGTHFWIDPINGVAAVYMKNSLIDGGSANESACMFESAVWNAME